METLNDWTLKFSTSFKNPLALYRFLGWELPREIEEAARSFSIFIPERLAKKIKSQGPNGPLAKEFLPNEFEIDPNLPGLIDPIGDKVYQKAPQLIHRYPNRVLFTPTSVCPVHCRYCFRRNELSSKDELFHSQFDETLNYLKAHPEIHEVIFTGGDPLTLSNEKLERYLLAFAEIKSIRFVRLHTRYPVILPERIDAGFLSLLEKASTLFQSVTLAIHANHIDEFDEETDKAIEALAHTPIQLLSQTVLLKDVNDSPEKLSKLIEKFLSLKIRPYYLHHPDQVKGGMHFYLPLAEGRRIYGQLRQLLPGWALPHYVIDVPGGHGKVPAFNPENTVYSGQLLSREGSLVSITEPDLFV